MSNNDVAPLTDLRNSYISQRKGLCLSLITVDDNKYPKLTSKKSNKRPKMTVRHEGVVKFGERIGHFQCVRQKFQTCAICF